MRIHYVMTLLFVAGLFSGGLAPAAADDDASGYPWPRHTIDASSQGADGVRLADVNGDGLLDIATGWEEGGLVRVYLHPGHRTVKEPWPAVTVGTVASPEDAVFVDLDRDGAVDVVSCTEGSERTVYVHWAPKDPKRYTDPAAWETEAFPALQGTQQWMYALPMHVDGKRGIDLVVGAKNEGAEIGWLESPEDPRNLAAWRWHPLYQAGWIMSLIAADVDGDGDWDIVASDRRGATRGCFWLENPGPGPRQTEPWPTHVLGGGGYEVMFMDYADLDGDGRKDVVAATSGPDILFLRRGASLFEPWSQYVIPQPGDTGTGKSAAVGDIDLDGRLDVVFSCERAEEKRGLMWMSASGAMPGATWDARDISGVEGVKFDRIVLIDLDGDGDLDVLTCEERDELGVIWYENPAKP